MAPFSPGSWLTAWTFAPFGAAVSLALVAAYVVLLLRARRRGVAWPWWRSALYVVLGVGSLVYVTCGPVGAYRTTLFWMFGAQVAVLSAVTPLGLALADPIGLLHAGSPANARDPRWARVLRGHVARFLMFPLVASAIASASIVLVFFTRYAESATRTSWVGDLLTVQLLVTGTLVVLPLLTDELLPAWVTPPVRTVFAMVDGLLDAIPGILVMTANGLLAPRYPGFAAAAAHARNGMSHSLDQKFAGGSLLVVAETVGIPLMAAVFVQWLRSDEADARAIDAALDAREQSAAADASRSSESASRSSESASGSASRSSGSAARSSGTAGHTSGSASRSSETAPAAESTSADAGSDEPAGDQPWWLTDPRFADRYRRRAD